MQLKGFGDIRTSKNWSRTQSLLLCFKCLVLLTTPNPELVLAYENGKRLGDEAKVLDELTVVIYQTQESTKFRHIDQCHDLLQSLAC